MYIFHLDPADGALEVARRQPHETIALVLLRKTRDALSALGYAAELRGPEQAHPNTYCLTLSDDTRTITIEYLYTLEDSGRQLTIAADVRMAGPPRPPDPSGSSHRGHASSSSRTRRVTWHDSCPWDQAASAGKTTRTKQVMLSDPTPLTLDLGLAFAAKDHYTIHVEVLAGSDWPSAGSPSLSQQLTRVGKRGSDVVRDYWRDAAERRKVALAPAVDLKSTPRTRTTRGRPKADGRDDGRGRASGDPGGSAV